MSRLVQIAFGLLVIFGCSNPEPRRRGAYAGRHWLKMGALYAEFPTDFQVYWPDVGFKEAKGWIVRGDSCFFTFTGEGSTSLEVIAKDLSNSRREGVIDTLNGKEFVIAYNWNEWQDGYEFSGSVIPIDTAAHRIFAIHPGWYWSPGGVESYPGHRVSREQLDSIRTFLKRGFVKR